MIVRDSVSVNSALKLVDGPSTPRYNCYILFCSQAFMSNFFGTFLIAMMTCGCGSQVFIYEVNPSQGSIYGGTRLVIRGSGFSSNTNALSNQIYIGTRYGCDLIPLHSTVNQIVCKTRPAIDVNNYVQNDVANSGVQNIVVVVDGAQSSTCSPSSQGKKCSFEYLNSWFFTPRIDSLSPKAVSTGTMITISGRFHSAPFAFKEVRAPRLEVPLASVKVTNPSVEQQQPANEPFGQSGTRCMLFDPVSEQPYPLIQSGDLVSSFVCQIGGREGGRYNMSVALLGQAMSPDSQMNMGESQVLRDAFTFDHRGTAFMLQHAAVITGFRPNASGLLGGARLTVFGDGFSPDAAAMRVEVAGRPCPIVTTAPTQLVCELPPFRYSSPTVHLRLSRTCAVTRRDLAQAVGGVGVARLAGDPVAAVV